MANNNKSSSIERVCEYIRNEMTNEVSTLTEATLTEATLTETTAGQDYLYELMFQANTWRQEDADCYSYEEESEPDFNEKWGDF
jgi:hypothetical protein